MIHFVYITTDLSTGKQYIGDHYGEERDSYLGSGIHLLRAIRRYGSKNFKRHILEIFETKKEAFDAQEKYIKKYNTLEPNGYNISPTGGLRKKGCLKHSVETKRKISESRMGEKNWNYGKTRKKTCRQKIRNTLKIPINQLDLYGNFIKKWDSAIKVEEIISIRRSNICKVLKGERKQTGGYKWEYANET